MVSLVLLAGLLCSLLAPVSATAQAATMEEYLQKVVDWGVMRGDINGNLNPQNSITRAEFVAMVNRAYGYTDMGEVPFTDIKPSDWYYEDISIAYNTGYFTGMSETTAAPNDTLTREQAAVLIGRNMMLEEGVGEALGFSDSRQLEEWSRHLIQAVAEEGIIGGYEDGSFKPKRAVTRGEVAAMLARAIGTPIQRSGTHSLGGVYGNLTITSPGTILKDTTVVGDLYISGGLGLGDVTLENVTVLGRIVVSGAGESERGGHSVTLRNVSADEMVVDSMASQFVTLKAEGFTNVGEVKVRTASYLEDVTEDGLGLQSIRLEGESGTPFFLAGNIKDVLNLTENSTLNIAQGVAQTVTVDETALGSTLNVSNGASVETVNLDSAANVVGDNVNHLNVNSPGSVVESLPDTITVRPGITADISGETMDTVAAEESSMDPRLLAGYPDVRNVAPTSADAIFKTNKRGTIHWALTALADGSLEEEELINPPAYSGKIIKSGTVSATAADTEFTAKLSGLITDGSYYVSAVLVDNRGMRSPVKVASFTTPDNTVPAFTSGYPYTIIADGSDGEQIVQAMVMANKDCMMYYALMPKGAKAPTAADFKADSLSGNLGHGVVELKKNTPFLVSKVNSAYLEEETDYELYLWLTDVDGVNSSSVQKLTVTTLDRTPPRLQYLRQAEVTASSVTLTYALSEPGTLYWAVVKDGTLFYTSEDEGYYATVEGMVQVENGLNALKKGTASAAKESTDYRFTISGLEAQTAYDIYYVIKDKAGNYGVYDVASIELPYPVHTLDSEAPTVKQEFTHDGSSGAALTPYPDTSIRLVFSEDVQGMLDLDGDSRTDKTSFRELYAACRAEGDMERFADVLREYIKLYTGDGKQVNERHGDNDDPSDANYAGSDWVIDYRKATVEMDSSGTGEMIITFPYNEDSGYSALNLAGGQTYYFELGAIADRSTAENLMDNVRGVTILPSFTTISAQILLTEDYAEVPGDHDGDPAGEEKWSFDFVFSASPNSNDAMADAALWDLVVWSEVSIQFKVYESLDEGESWAQVGSSSGLINTSGAWLGASMGAQLRGGGFQKLNELDDRFYAIEITSIAGETRRDNWNVPITLQITAVAGDKGALTEMGNMLQNSRGYAEAVENNTRVTDISAPLPLPFTLTRTFMDDTPPGFDSTFPKFTPGDSSVRMEVSMDRSGAYFYYVVAPLGSIVTTTTGGLTVVQDNYVTNPAAEMEWSDLPENGSDSSSPVYLNSPTSDTIMNLRSTTTVKVGSGAYNGVVEEVTVSGLQPNTQYLAYFVLRGESQSSYSPKAYVYRFETGDVETPTIELSDSSPSVGIVTSTDTELDWILVASPTLSGMSTFTDFFYNKIGVNNTNKNDLVDLDTNRDGQVSDDEVKAHFVRNFQYYFPNLSNYNTTNDTTTGTTATAVVNHLDVRVIDALTANMGTNDYRSVFDYYAGTGVYNQVLNAITQSTGASYRADSGSMNTRADQYYAETSDKMSALTQYYFIAAARNTMGTMYGFKAIDSIHVVDNAPPDVSYCGTYAEPCDSTGNPITTGTINQYKGTLTITFTKDPYRTYTGANNQVITLPMTENGSTASWVKDQISTAGVTLGDVSVDGRTIQIEFSGVKNNSTLTLFKNGTISDSLGNTLNKTLVLTFKGSNMFVEGGYSAEFSYAWK